MSERKKKYALVLSGGGFNGAFQVGALNYINDNWKNITGKIDDMRFDVIAGVSTGALNGSLVAMSEMQELNDLWVNRIGRNGVSEIYTSDFVDTSSKSAELMFNPNIAQIMKRFLPKFEFKFSWKEKLGLVFSKKKRAKIFKRIIHELECRMRFNFSKFKSLADNTPLRYKLKYLLRKSRIFRTKFYCGFVSLDTGEYHNVEHTQFVTDEDFINGVLASTAMPLIWKPVEKVTYNKEGKEIVCLNNVDGGVRNVSPLGDLIQLINKDQEFDYKIIVINCHNETLKHEEFENKGIGAIATRSVYEIAFNEIFRNDIQAFTQTNSIVKQTRAWDYEIALFNKNKEEIRSFDVVMINPDKDFDLGNALVANKELIESRMQHGNDMAKLIFNAKKGDSKWI